MVNFGLNSASILGIFLAVAGAALYFMRSVRPELSRDHDIFFAAVGLLCGLILLFQGWRLDPILQFGQFLLTGAAVFFAVETIRLRGATTEQAKRNSPIVDRERPVSNVYRAELEQLEPYDEEDQYENNPQLRGYADARPSRNSGYDAEDPRTQKNRRPSDRYNVRETPRRTRRPSTPSTESYDDWSDTPNSLEERPTSSRPRRPRSDSDLSEPTSRTPRKRRPRPSNFDVAASDTSEATPTDYVDYQPIDPTQPNNSDWDQEQESERNPNRDRNEDNPVRFDY